VALGVRFLVFLIWGVHCRGLVLTGVRACRLLVRLFLFRLRFLFIFLFLFRWGFRLFLTVWTLVRLVSQVIWLVGFVGRTVGGGIWASIRLIRVPKLILNHRFPYQLLHYFPTTSHSTTVLSLTNPHQYQLPVYRPSTYHAV
jgi:hypothetical protein